MTASQAEAQYDVDIQSRRQVNELQGLEQIHGDTVYEWLDEGMPREVLGTPEEMRAFRKEKETSVSSTVEAQNRRSVQRMVPQNQDYGADREWSRTQEWSSQHRSESDLNTIQEVDQHIETEDSTWVQDLWGSLADTTDLAESELLTQPAQQLSHQAGEILAQGHAIRHEKQALDSAFEKQKQNLDAQFRRRATRLVSKRQLETDTAKQRAWHRALEENESLRTYITTEQQKLAADDTELDQMMTENIELLLRMQPLAERETQGESLRDMLSELFPQVVTSSPW